MAGYEGKLQGHPHPLMAELCPKWPPNAKKDELLQCVEVIDETVEMYDGDQSPALTHAINQVRQFREILEGSDMGFLGGIARSLNFQLNTNLSALNNLYERTLDKKAVT